MVKRAEALRTYQVSVHQPGPRSMVPSHRSQTQFRICLDHTQASKLKHRLYRAGSHSVVRDRRLLLEWDRQPEHQFMASSAGNLLYHFIEILNTYKQPERLDR